MVNFVSKNGHGPIGLEINSRAVQLMQFSAGQTRLIDAVRWDLPRAAGDQTADTSNIIEAIQQARQGRKFRGRNVVACLGARDVFVQNVRVPKGPTAELANVVQQDAASRLPFPAAEADIRFVCAGEVRQGDQVRREVVLLACHRPVIDRLLGIVDAVGLRAVALDVEPAALLRAYVKQFRRDDDYIKRVMFVRLGNFNSTVVIAQGTSVVFVKNIDVGAEHLDDAVARHLKISLDEAATLRANNGERRADQQDPELVATITEATRGVVERLVNELSLCLRYHSVAFRGQAIDRLILGGGDASQALVEVLESRLDLKCQLGDPLRSFEAPLPARRAQWDVTAGLALRNEKD
jgi:type IV pilus assembly protein PilM